MSVRVQITLLSGQSTCIAVHSHDLVRVLRFGVQNLAEFFFWLLDFLTFGFLAFRLFGLMASRLLGFSAFCWFMWLLVAFWLFASSAFPVPLRRRWLFGFCSFCLVYVAFARLLAALAFRILRAFWLLRPFIGIWIWLPASSASPPPYLNHHFFGHHGGGTPPNPPATV